MLKTVYIGSISEKMRLFQGLAGLLRGISRGKLTNPQIYAIVAKLYSLPIPHTHTYCIAF